MAKAAAAKNAGLTDRRPHRIKNIRRKICSDECAKVHLPEPQIIIEGEYTKIVFMRPELESKARYYI